jgi:hypothetical protein
MCRSGVIAPRFLTSVLDAGVSGQQHAPVALSLGAHCIGGCVGPRADLEAIEENLLFLH